MRINDEIPFLFVTKNKDLLELASIRSMTQVIWLLGHMGSGNNYYKRVTF